MLPALRDRPQKVQMVGGPVSSPVKRDLRGTLEQGRRDSGAHLPLGQVTSEVPKPMLHMLLREGGLFQSGTS